MKYTNTFLFEAGQKERNHHFSIIVSNDGRYFVTTIACPTTNNEVNVDVGIAIRDINIIHTASPDILGGLCSIVMNH
jgi:hypothetical protein